MKKQNRYNRNYKNSAKKEKAIMLASSVFVLTALTLTGVYVKGNSEKEKNDGYNIDFNTLENETPKGSSQLTEKEPSAMPDFANSLQDEFMEVPQDDLDYSPIEEVDSGLIEIPGLTDAEEGFVLGKEIETLIEEAENAIKEESINEIKDEVVVQKEVEIKQEEVFVPDVEAGDYLLWPVTGNVIIPYSMDQTVYFPTLEQYKYSPALVISATEGCEIYTVAGGYVTDVFTDEEIGNAVSVDIGNGYEVIYGQLKDVSVKEGDLLKKGQVIGNVATPTKYYSVEGTNAYFALKQNGESRDPLGVLE